MFSGVIRQRGTVAMVRAKKEGGKEICVRSALKDIDFSHGASICCNGICLSVAEVRKDGFCVDVSPTTLERTTCGAWKEGDDIHLEPSLRVGDALDGHLVFGHVDAVAQVVSFDGELLKVVLPASLRRLVALRGSLAVDGVSLTIAACTDDAAGTHVSFALIPVTCAMTHLGDLQKDDAVNVEVDVLARYVLRMKGEG